MNIQVEDIDSCNQPLVCSGVPQNPKSASNLIIDRSVQNASTFSICWGSSEAGTLRCCVVRVESNRLARTALLCDRPFKSMRIDIIHARLAQVSDRLCRRGLRKTPILQRQYTSSQKSFTNSTSTRNSSYCVEHPSNT